MRWYVRGAWTLLAISIVAWPLSQFTWAKDEPRFVLALSWLAIVLTATDVLVTAHVKRDQEAAVTPTSPNGPTVPPNDEVDPRDQAADGDPVGDPDTDDQTDQVRDPAELERNPDEPEE